MTTFKDLLSKDTQTKLKQLSKPQAPKPIIAPTPKVDDDTALFAKAMQGVTPLKHEKNHTHAKPKDSPNALYRRANAQGADDMSVASLSDMQALMNPVAGEAILSYKHPTLQNKVFEQLRQGKLRWYDAVDLHGTSIDDARTAVLTLIHHAKQNGETVVKIVHGKGSDAVIKTCVNGWLRQIPDVMAFVSAPTKNGGNGAVLVLLKHTKWQAPPHVIQYPKS